MSQKSQKYLNIFQTKRDNVAFFSTGCVLGCVSIWYSCRFSIFSALSVELDWVASTSRHTASCQLSTILSGTGWCSPCVQLRTMSTYSALVERMLREAWCERVGGGKLRLVGEVNGCEWGWFYERGVCARKTVQGQKMYGLSSMSKTSSSWSKGWAKDRKGCWSEKKGSRHRRGRPHFRRTVGFRPRNTGKPARE